MKNLVPVETIGIYGKKPLLEIVFAAHAHLRANFTYLSENIQYPDEVQQIWDIWRRAFDKRGIVLMGDCDEFMQQMIYILWLCKVPLKFLYLSVGHAPTNEGHAIPFVMVENTLWQMDNMLKKPIPAWYGYNCVGYYVSQYSNGIFNMKEKRYRKFKVSKLKKPCEVKLG